MRFTDIDPVEIGFFIIFFVGFLQAHGLATERASCMTPKNQYGYFFGFG